MKKLRESAEYRTVSKEELMDLLINHGILQEVNRTFLNPVGLDLTLTEELNLKMMKTDDLNGIVKHTIDKNQIRIFSEYRKPRHEQRQKNLGFLIQIGDVIRKNLIQDNTITPTSTLKLNYLLKCVDNIAYEVKKRFMEKSKTYDSHLENIDYEHIGRMAEADAARENYVDAIAKLILVHFKKDIDIKLNELRKIDKKQKSLLKGNE